MIRKEHTKRLLDRLWRACSKLPNYGGDLWGRGLNVLERKYNINVFLTDYVPSDMIEGEQESVNVTISIKEK